MTREQPGEDASPEHLDHAAEAINDARSAAREAKDVIDDPEGGWEATPPGEEK